MDNNLIKIFKSTFGDEPRMFVRAPGRVNIIGGHTDYNDGFVMPIAIDRFVWVAFRPRSDDQIKLHSLEFDSVADFSFNNFKHTLDWQDYVKSVAWVLRINNYTLKGWEGILSSNIPIGAGLSSSAALLMAILKVFSIICKFSWNGHLMAQFARQAENEWLNLKSGIMDQMISSLGRDGHAMLLDCRSLSPKFVPIPSKVKIIVLDTGTRRGLLNSKYNERVKQCKESANYFGCDSLRDISIEIFEEKKDGLSNILLKRARHVIYENYRTIDVSKAMKQKDVKKIGYLMNVSHQSLKEDYGVSSKELDIMVNIAREQKGCFGARMTGAGFGGCAIALVDQMFQKQFMKNIFDIYNLKTGIKPNIYLCEASSGVRSF